MAFIGILFPLISMASVLQSDNAALYACKYTVGKFPAGP